MSISSSYDRKKFRDALQEVSNSFTRISAERDLIKDIVKELSEQFQLPRKTVSKMAKVYHKQSFGLEQQEFSEFESLYEEVVNIQNPQS